MTVAPPPQRTDRRALVSWALWDWGSAAFNAVVTTFVFSTYLASRAFVDPALVAAEDSSPAAKQAVQDQLAHNATVVSTALTIAGIVVALVAPAVGRLADSSGHRRRSVLVATIGVALSIGAMVFVAPSQPLLVLGAALIGIGTVAYEIACVGYNAMLSQVAPGRSTGRVSAIGWAAGYFGGIVLLVVLLVLCIQDFGAGDTAGLLDLPATVASGQWDVRVAIGIAAVWLAVSSIPLFLVVPEAERDPARAGTLLSAYRDLGRDVARLWRERRNVLAFLVASAVFRDGVGAVFTFGGIIAAQVFGFSASQVILFAIVANVVAGIATFASGRLDDRFGSRALIMVSLVGLAVCGTAVIFVGSAPAGFWVLGLALCVFVGPVQSSSRSYLTRLATPGREGELFGLYATTGRAASFIAPAMFGLAVTIGGSTRFGIIGVVVVLVAGLVLMAFVKPEPRVPAAA
ncbi:MFS transporter [Curtobacterium sp. VKM Ac-2865]|uniref:MFS transporter n=1 Tax=Curtobacterium sp. VKM Ac-2865 TaxID=2783817 RepID=UPI00188AA7A9|nr:MFS transporter [Curtobacterium sp. VKM Ac-2865]MBF4583900.1 MFS transporter [Curtobacterium sp. VKM Ac-2865]